MRDFVLLGLFKPNPFRKEQRSDTDYTHRHKKYLITDIKKYHNSFCCYVNSKEKDEQYCTAESLTLSFPFSYIFLADCVAGMYTDTVWTGKLPKE